MSETNTSSIPPDAPGAETSRQPGFRLVRYFSIASFAAIAIATGLMATLYEQQALRNLLQTQGYHHVALLRLVSNVLWPRFSSFVAESARLDTGALKAHAEIARIHQMLQTDLAGTGVLKVKIFDLAGRTVFSTESAQIGEDRSKSERFVAARAGKIATDLTRRDHFDAFGQSVQNVEIVSSYVPVRKDGSGDIEAVFEVYSDISSLMAGIRGTRNTLAVQALSLLLALYLALFFIVRHADAVIRKQTSQHAADVDALHQARNELGRSEQFHRALIERASDAVVVLDAGLNVVHAAATVQDALGRSSGDMVGTALADCALPEYREPVNAWLAAAAAQPGAANPFEYEGEHPSRGRRFFIANATNLLADSAVHGIVVNIRDITGRKQAEMQARQLALYDELTGLARRDFFAEQAHKAIAFAKRFKEPLAILFLDLDGFKRVNDELGHGAGDELLKAVADRMRVTLREGDTIGRYAMFNADDHVARFGGDEFMILLTRLRKPDDAVAVAKRLLASLSKPYALPGGGAQTVTASVGIASFPNDGESLEALMKCADRAMYSAKVEGKNAYKLFSDV